MTDERQVELFCPKCGHKMVADMDFEHEVNRRVREILENNDKQQ